MSCEPLHVVHVLHELRTASRCPSLNPAHGWPSEALLVMLMGDMGGQHEGNGGRKFKRKLSSGCLDIADDPAVPSPESLTKTVRLTQQAANCNIEENMTSPAASPEVPMQKAATIIVDTPASVEDDNITAAEVFAKLRLEIRALWGRVHDLEFKDYRCINLLEQRVSRLEVFANVAQRRYRVLRGERSRRDGTDAV